MYYMTKRAWPSPDLRRCGMIAIALSLFALNLAPVNAPAQDKAAVLLPGSINDQSWNAQGYAGVVRLKEKGWNVAYSENVQPADMAQALEDYARKGYTLIIGHTGRFLSPMQLVGPKFSKTTFIVGSGNAGAGKNVASIDFDNTQFGYLIGVMAARMNKTGKIGSVNGLEGLPNVVAQVGAYRSGKLNAGQLGIIQAAKEKGIHANGRSVEDTEIAPDTVLTNIVEKWGDMYAAAGDESKAGTLGGKFELYGLNSKGCTGAELLYTKDKELNPAIPQDVVDELQAVKKKFASGELKVSVTKEDARGGL